MILLDKLFTLKCMMIINLFLSYTTLQSCWTKCLIYCVGILGGIVKGLLFFYKFVSFDRIDILQNGLIRFSPIGDFNDPFELVPSITPYSKNFLEHVNELSELELQKMEFNEEDLMYSSERVDQVECYKEKYRKEIARYGVLSLSSNTEINQLLTVSMSDKRDPRTNILMWSHYADSHKGFVIEFRADFVDEIKLRKVYYSNDRDYLTFEDIDENSFDDIFFKKSIEWAYEQEYRAILPLDKAYKVHDERFHLYKINKASINSITFGCAMSEENKKAIIDSIRNDADFGGVKFNHARLNDSSFLLDFYYDDGRCTNNPDLFGARKIPNQKNPNK